ncbi:hypothetical protein BN946_scf184969.g39 [Trametes cinnabarina]|uniref:Sister chromatid cohesion protein DCC1 n=1 Tax=Pycnoporus cinnabarinus TaxID=5643 RepID=A0A060SYQ7_PYCCI|nr:hypothetical protein BN946_scf184969.g39 [Trametes cinnabarina]
MSQLAEFDLRFSSASQAEVGSFKMLELSPDLCKLIEATVDDSFPADPVMFIASFLIKGAPDEDAVLCTSDKTYTVRSVVLSNSVCVVTRDPGDEGGGDDDEAKDVAIRDQLKEILELVPSVPRLHKLNALLRGREYDEGHEDEDDMCEDEEGHSIKRARFTYEDARAMIQASDGELDKGLRDRRVLILKGTRFVDGSQYLSPHPVNWRIGLGELRPIAPSHLTTILELILTNLVSNSLSYTSAPVSTLISALEDEHDIRRDVSLQVMAWFGHINEHAGGTETWDMDADAVVREVGLGILRVYRSHQEDPVIEKAFVDQWKKAVGDTFEDRVSLPLLSGNYLTSKDTLSDPPIPLLTYFPSSALPVEPGARFSELFLTRPRWKADEIAPFLSDIAVDSKERDKLLLKHARAITDSEGIWYTARAKYNA